MELVGDEKRIQALFSEQVFADQSLAPRFEKLWMRAETNARVPAVKLARPLAAIAVVVILAAVCLLAASAWYRSSESQNMANVPPQSIPAPSVHLVKEPEKILSAGSTKGLRPERRRPVRHRQTERVATHETATLANWQSPTSIFLQSPTALALGSLPQLDQSARELEKFLPKNNEVMKESKQ